MILSSVDPKLKLTSLLISGNSSSFLRLDDVDTIGGWDLSSSGRYKFIVVSGLLYSAGENSNLVFETLVLTA